MDIPRLVRKLRPLIPEKIDRWMRARQTADATLRDLIDQQVITESRKLLRDNNQPLLSLPPQKLARGKYRLGTVIYNQKQWPFGLDDSDLIQHTILLGRSGSGKTSVLLRLLKQLTERQHPFILFDVKRNGRDLLSLVKQQIAFYTPGRRLNPLPFNPLIEPPGMERGVYLGQVLDVMTASHTLGEGARSLIRRTIDQLDQELTRPPTIRQVLDAMNQAPLQDREQGWRLTAQRVLGSLEAAIRSPKTPPDQHEMMRVLATRPTVIELDSLDRPTVRFLVPILCLWLYHLYLVAPQREQHQLTLILEEAHHFLAKNTANRLMSTLLRQSREIGIAFVVIDQQVSLLSPQVTGNMFTSICLNQKDPLDVNKAAALCSMDDADKQTLTRLPVGYGVVKMQGRWPEPFLVRFDHEPIVKGHVTDDRLHNYLKGQVSGGPPRSGDLSPLGPGVPGVHLWDEAMQPRAIAMIEDVLANPDDGVRVRYQRLSLSAGSGHRLKMRLVRSHWLQEQIIHAGSTRKIVLQPTRTALQALGLTASRPRGYESVAHAYWKRWWARRYEALGYRVQIEAPRHGGRVDVLAFRPGTGRDATERVGIEVETGSSDFVSNVKAGLLSGFTRVLVVATDVQAREAIEAKLAAAGLLGVPRVKVVERDEAG